MPKARSVADIFSADSALSSCLRAEAALATAQAELGIIPPEAAREIAAHARIGELDVPRIREQTRRTGHPIAPLVRQLTAACGENGRYVHWGATTQEIRNTTLALQVNEALGALEKDLCCEHGVWHNHRAVTIGHDYIVRIHGHPSAANRFLPVHEGKARHGGRGSCSLGPNIKVRSENSIEVTHNAIRDETIDAELSHACARNVAENARIGNAQRARYANATLLHRLYRSTSRDGSAPRLGRGEILARRRETESEGSPDLPRLAGP